MLKMGQPIPFLRLGTCCLTGCAWHEAAWEQLTRVMWVRLVCRSGCLSGRTALAIAIVIGPCTEGAW
jgi:hypothetical protein